MAEIVVLSALLVFLSVLVGAFSLHRLTRVSDNSCGTRLLEPRFHTASHNPLLRNQPSTHLAASLIGWFSPRSRLGLGTSPKQRRLVAALAHAGFVGFDRFAIFSLVQLLVGGAFALIGLGIAWSIDLVGIELALPFGVVGYILPTSVLRRLGRKRQTRIARELPSILDLMIVCLEAGLGLAEAVRLVGREAERHGQVLGAEFGVAAAEMSAGVSLGDSLRNLADRWGSDELKNLAALIIQSDQMGTRLGPALRASGEQFAAKRRTRAEEKAQRSAVHMLFPLVTLILPAMLIVILGPAIIQVLAVLN